MGPKAPFQLVGYFYTNSFFSANKEFSVEKFQMPSVNAQTNMHQDEDDPDIWNVGLFVGLPDGTDPTTVPYDFWVSVMGIFHFPAPEEISDEDLLQLKKVLYVNGSSMLYSSVRDHIRTLTASGPYRPFILPTYRFDPEDALSSIEEN